MLVFLIVQGVPAETVETSLKSVTCQALANLSKRNNFVPVHDSTNLVKVIQTFCTNYKDLHRFVLVYFLQKNYTKSCEKFLRTFYRLPMIDKDGKLIGIVSQSLL